MEEVKYSFLVIWDTESLQRKFNLSFWPEDGSVQMFDLKHKRLFLKRTRCNSVSEALLYIGNTLTVLGRQLTIESFGDQFTADKLGSSRQTCAGVAVNAEGLLALLRSAGQFSLLRSTQNNTNQPGSLNAAFVLQNVDRSSIAGKPGLEMFDSDTAAIDATRNAASPAVIDENSTLCIVKPKSVEAGHTADIVEAILAAGLSITAVQLFTLGRAEADEFLEVYKGIATMDYNKLCAELCSGSIIAMAINGDNALARMRELAGPFDPNVAKHIRPECLRARFGRTMADNGVHVTDVDGGLECEYFFKILCK